MSTTRTLWEPEGFDPRDFGFWKSKDQKGVRVFISRVLTSHVAADRGGYTPIRRQEVRAVLGTFEKKRDQMEKMGLIECDHEARIGEKAFHYRLGPEWRSRPIRHRKTNDAETLRLWLAIRGLRPEGAVEPADPVKTHLNSWLRRLTLDPGVIERGMAGVVGEERRRYAQMVIELTLFGDPGDREGDYCTYGRFHSLITRMPKWMREAIRIDGQPLGETDIKACQPMIQANLASQAIINTPATHRTPSKPTPNPNTHTHKPPHTIVSGNAPIPTLNAPIHTLAPNLPPDLIEFFEQYEAGVDYYVWFASKIGMPCETEDERGDVKEAWAWLVYDEPQWHIPVWRKRWEAYSESCPSIASWLERTKRYDYREAARECQRYESRLMIQEVCRDLLENHPAMPILTIHDAIMAPDEGLDAVSETIRRVWGREGVAPRLKVIPSEPTRAGPRDVRHGDKWLPWHA